MQLVFDQFIFDLTPVANRVIIAQALPAPVVKLWKVGVIFR